MPTTVSLRRELYLPRSLVFDAWTGSEHLSGWFPPDGCRVQEATVEPAPGGRLAVAWTDPAGRPAGESWQFVRVERPAGFECVGRGGSYGGNGDGSRLVVALSDLEDACVIEVAQSGVAEAAAEAAGEEWKGRLDRLERYFAVI